MTTSFLSFIGWMAFLLPTSVFASGSDLESIALGFITTLLPIWIPVAVIAIVIAGFNLSISRDEGAMDKAKSQIILVIIGGITITLLLAIGPTTFIGKFYNGAIDSSAILSAPVFIEFETIGIAEWIITIMAAIGILMIILSLLEAVTSLGDEGAYTKVRTAVLNVVIGLLIIVAAKIIRTTFFSPINGGVANPAPLMTYIIGKITIVLNFILVIAVAIVIYAGFRMVMSFGNEDDYNNAKSLVLRVLIGILVLLISYSLVAIVVRIF